MKQSDRNQVSEFRQTSTRSAKTINQPERQVLELRLQLDERDQYLAAARAANHELIAQLNTATRHR